jgi:hypothetical protein
MDPIVSLHYYAPVCAVINACILPFIEGLEPFYNLHRVGLLVLLTNAGMAFALNVRGAMPRPAAGSKLTTPGRRCFPHLRGVGVDPDPRRRAERHCQSHRGVHVVMPTSRLTQPVTDLGLRHCVRKQNHRSASVWLYVSRTGVWRARARLTIRISLGGLVMFKTTGGK